jgi:hypothetical protein
MAAWNPEANAIFLQALELPAPERPAYLDRTCGARPELRAQVDALLAASASAGSFLETPAVAACSAAPDPPPEPAAETDLPFLEPPRTPGGLGRLGCYEVLGVVGRGGMGIVLRAFDEKLHRVVALKVLAPELAASPTARQRFTREARAAAAVSHEHVVTFHAVEADHTPPYLVMQFVEGVSLQEKLDRVGPLGLHEILRIGVQTAEGLAAAHKQGLVHRDVKPANILLENGIERVRLTDFGLARAADDAALTQTGVIAGTPQYMSPEQAEGQPLDARSDLFSLGSVLYAMCTGLAPFRGASAVAVLRRVCEETPRPVRELNPDVPAWLAAVIARLHAKAPAERYQSAAEVAAVLGRHLRRLQLPHAQDDSTAEDESPTPAAPRRRPVRWLAAAVLLALAGLGFTEAADVTRLTGTVIRLLRPDGTLVVAVEDPDVSVAIDGEDLVFTGAGLKEIRLRPGAYRLRASKDGQVVRQEVVTITTGGRRVVQVSREPAPAAAERKYRPPPGADPEWDAANWVLAAGGRVVVFAGWQQKAVAAPADLPDAHFEVIRIVLRRHPRVTDADVARLAGLKHLEEVNLEDTAITDAALSQLGRLATLTALGLAHTAITDAGLAHLAGLKHLAYFDLADTGISDAGLGRLAGLPELRDLSLEGTRVTDAGLAPLARLPVLSHLNLSWTLVTGTGLGPFAELKTLHRLDLRGDALTDRGLGTLARLRSLRELDIKDSGVMPAGVEWLSRQLPACKLLGTPGQGSR